MWALLSGIEGNLAAYEAVLADLQRQQPAVEALYILGDLVGPRPECEALVRRVQQPRPGELQPQICTGWWEEQCFNLYGLGPDQAASDLRDRFGSEGVERLWQAVPRQSVQWLRGLDFGFFELDCLLIHGSTVGPSDCLTPETSPVQLLDRLLRAEANTLFCGRSGLAFQLELAAAALDSRVTTLSGQTESSLQPSIQRQVVGVGSVGRSPGVATYTLYNSNTGRVSFRDVSYGVKPVGFGQRR